VAPQRELLTQEELVELRRLHRRSGEHGVDLTAMMDLVLEEVRQHVPGALHLHVILALAEPVNESETPGG